MGRGQYLNGRKILMTGRKILPQIGKAYIGIDKYTDPILVFVGTNYA